MAKWKIKFYDLEALEILNLFFFTFFSEKVLASFLLMLEVYVGRNFLSQMQRIFTSKFIFANWVQKSFFYLCWNFPPVIFGFFISCLIERFVIKRFGMLLLTMKFFVVFFSIYSIASKSFFFLYILRLRYAWTFSFTKNAKLLPSE